MQPKVASHLEAFLLKGKTNLHPIIIRPVVRGTMPLFRMFVISSGAGMLSLSVLVPS
jgi:hypothetical protein